jgi:hypothetical protein
MVLSCGWSLMASFSQSEAKKATTLLVVVVLKSRNSSKWDNVTIFNTYTTFRLPKQHASSPQTTRLI